MKSNRMLKAAATLLLSTILFSVTGCSHTESSSVSQADSAQASQETDPSQTSEISEKLVTDLSSVLPQTQNMVLSDYAVKDDQHLLLLYADTVSEKPTFSLYQTNIHDKSVQVITESQAITCRSRTKQTHSLVIADADRQIIIDKAEGTFYYLPEKEIVQPDMDIYFEEPAVISDCFIMDCKLWCINIHGQLYEMQEKDGEHIACNANYPPVGYEFDSLTEIRNGSEIIIRMTSERASAPDSIYASTNPLNYQNNYYTADTQTSDTICAVSENYQAIRNDNTLILRTKDQQEYHCDLADLPDCLEAIKTNKDALYISSDAVNDDTLYFTIQLSDDTEKLFAWHYSGESSQKVTPTVFTEYTIPAITKEDTDTLIQQFRDEFGITVLSHDQVPDQCYYYSITPLNDEEYIFNALQLLQAVCRNYPEGIFRQIQPETNPMKIYLVDGITDTTNTSVSNPPGITTGTDLMLSATIRLSRGTIYHEINHVLVGYMEAHGGEEDLTVNFNTLNPEGFVYGENYKNENTVEYTPLDPEDTDFANVYFASDYGKTNSDEDMAEMMMALMGSCQPDEYCQCTHIQAKYRYLFGLFRKYFDTTGWEQTLTWEKRLDTMSKTA